MDLTQTKLTKTEWENIEIPVSDQEKRILQMIIDGYHNVNLRRNDSQSLLSNMKIDHSPEIEAQLYKQYFEPEIQDMTTKYIADIQDFTNSGRSDGTVVAAAATPKKNAPPLKTRDLIRIQSIDSKIEHIRGQIFEFILLGFCRDILQSISAAASSAKERVLSTSGTSKNASSSSSTAINTFCLYTLIQLKTATIPLVNERVIAFVDRVIAYANRFVELRDVLLQAFEFIERNPFILKYEDRTLFDHQKQIFTIFRNQSSATGTAAERGGAKLVLYTAPTGTGKTLTPLGLSEGYRIIFICAARHVGLALAKSAVSIGKRIAIAFGCETADDIRLHYFAASEYTRHRKSGGIGKVDNSVGDKVEIMICDVQSYLIAMHYMLAFSPPSSSSDEEGGEEQMRDSDLITYWDEPTISMDYHDHPLHTLIHRNWQDNQISKMVLSCATLPKEEEIYDTIVDFRAKFTKNSDYPETHTITSYDCRKSISLLNKIGKSVVPHLLFQDYAELQRCAVHCSQNKALLRYFDLTEIIRLIEYVHAIPDGIDAAYVMESYFPGGIRDITMNSLKLYYLDVLMHVSAKSWPTIYETMVQTQRPKFTTSGENEIRKVRSVEVASTIDRSNTGKLLTRMHSVSCVPPVLDPNTVRTNSNASASAGIMLTTHDAHTLTDGPTIFLTEDPEKVGRFYVQQSNIPLRVFQSVAEKIAQNSTYQKRMDILTHTLEDKTAACENKEQSRSKDAATMNAKKSGSSVDNKKSKRETISPEITKIMEQIEGLRAQIKVVSLDNAYIPNTKNHQRIWMKSREEEDGIVKNAFVPSVDEDNVRNIMGLDVTDQMKLLLLMGIGMFVDECDANKKYMEIMKRLAHNQQLFLILASSDYIYGTNYQFCHGFIGKDLSKMTQQKTIQAMGRIGRNQMQQEYTIRFREDEMLLQLFQSPKENVEAIVMSRLFYSTASSSI